MNRSRLAALAGAASIVGLTLLGHASPASAATASTQSLVAQTTYYCLASASSTSSAASTANYNVTARMQLTTPTSVEPGSQLTLGGVLTLQFDETLYRNAHLVGVTSVSGYSDTMSATSQINGKTSVVFADRWQTSPAPLSDPIVVSAPITFPAYTVPKTASGNIVLGLMQNGSTKNQISDSPPTVAFTAVANAVYGGGTIQFNLACYLTSGSPGVLGKIAVATPGAAAAANTGGARSGVAIAGSTSGTTASSATGGTTSGATTGSATTASGSAAAAVPGQGRTSIVSSGAEPGQAAASGTSDLAATGQFATSAAAAPSGPDEPGVYVPTGLLVFAGAAICVVALAYAAMANYRLRMIQRSLDD